MASTTIVFGSASSVVVTPVAPSGGRYEINALAISSGIVTARTYPSSGIIASISSNAALNGVHLLPSGVLGYGESIELTSVGIATATMEYILTTQFDQTNQFNYTSAAEDYSTRFASQQKWAFNPTPLSGSYVKTIN